MRPKNPLRKRRKSSKEIVLDFLRSMKNEFEENVSESLQSWADKTRLYQFYDILSKAHCFKTSDSPLCVEKLGAIKHEPNNAILTLNWKDGRKKMRTVFSEKSFYEATLKKNRISLLDSKKKKQELFLFRLENVIK